jgi:hypothetical protein
MTVDHWPGRRSEANSLPCDQKAWQKVEREPGDDIGEGKEVDGILVETCRHRKTRARVLLGDKD